MGAVTFFAKNPVFTIQVPKPFEKADPERLRTHVQTLTASSPPRNFAHPEALDKVAEIISKHFQELGIPTRNQEFQVGQKTFRNVIATLGPVEGETLVIGAHYDVCDDLPGADDNASGTAGLLELARLLAPLKNQLKRPIELVAYTLEEPPNFAEKTMGSYIHAQSLKEAGKNVKLMISLEMIGYFSIEPSSQKYPVAAFQILYPSIGNYIGLIARPQEWFVMRQVKTLFASATELPMQTANVPSSVPGVDLSDHLNYWNSGFPAMMITDTAFMRNKNYHKAEDLPETLDYQKMAEVVNGLVSVAVGL